MFLYCALVGKPLLQKSCRTMSCCMENCAVIADRVRLAAPGFSIWTELLKTPLSAPRALRSDPKASLRRAVWSSPKSDMELAASRTELSDARADDHSNGRLYGRAYG